MGGIQASYFYTMNAWKAVGGLDASLDYAMDTDLHIRFFKLGCSFQILNYP